MTSASTDPRPDAEDGPDPESADGWLGRGPNTDDELESAGRLGLARRSRALLGSLLAPHRVRVLFALLLVVLDNAAQLAGPLVIAFAIDRGVPAALDGRPGTLGWAIAGYAGTALVSAGARAGFILLAGRIGQDVLLELRGRIFAHTQRLSVDFHERYSSGRLISRLTNDVDSLNDLLENGLDGLLGSLLSLLGAAVLLCLLDAEMAAVVLAGVLPLALLSRWFQVRSRDAYRRTRSAIAAVIVQFVETMNGIRAVQAFRRAGHNETIMARLNATHRAAGVDGQRVVAVYLGGVRLVNALSVAAVLLLGAWRVTHGDLALGTLAAVLLYLGRLYDPVEDLAQFVNSYQSAAAALEKVASVLDEPPSVPPPAHPRPLPSPVRGELELADVSFAYPSAPGTPVLAPLSLRVPAGQTLALVGATGAGKSTLAKLVTRFYDPSTGAVTLDGVDLRELADAELRRAVVMVTQEPFLFSGSVAENVGLGRPSASRAEIEAALDAVGATAFVAALPDGADTDVRKRGGRLSAGQRQLLALARVLLADPAVVVLDEATSLLDIPSERAVQAALGQLFAGRTALIIAHRLSTVLVADRILVVSQGRALEDGTPAELLAGGGRFAELHTAWRDSLA